MHNREISEHERRILESDTVLRESLELAWKRVPVAHWPERHRRAVTAALAEVRSTNRTSAQNARTMASILPRWGLDLSVPQEQTPDPDPEQTAYNRDRILADFLEGLIRFYAQGRKRGK
ncbi:MAG: hypothetical protein RE468_04390 [Acidithiobacillus caldus]|uniref:hypothetical protein n=1 Tax=Acidithiobacillus caldus TaxID=33059 RepID=UPI00281697B6|nr:hypothetical protein [Acidithiobacillus caldus]WMT47856.1 MAG: hypothetical protein RE468_04390 [Acidithiobacillus caldus]